MDLRLAGMLVAAMAAILMTQDRPACAQTTPRSDQFQAPASSRPARAPRTLPAQPELDETEQIAPSQVRQPRPAAQTPARPRSSAFDHDPDLPAAVRPASAGPSTSAKRSPARIVACGGAFSKGSSHLQLAMIFGSENLTFGDVAGPEGTRLPASILFPKDPKRRLEVLWHNDGSRINPNLIVIEGQSTWTGPRGLRLGMPLAALEKANGKPVKLGELSADGITAVRNWDGGAFDTLPGGCRVGVRLSADAKAPAAARTAAQAKGDYTSRDETIKAIAPKVIEIIFGYPQ